MLQRFSRAERVTGIEPALSAWEEFLSHHLSVSCHDIGGPQRAPGGPYRPGLVARVWPDSLGSRDETCASWPELLLA